MPLSGLGFASPSSFATLFCLLAAPPQFSFILTANCCRFCSRGSLYHMLHSAAPPGGAHLQRQQLLSIWLGTARGMQHLHASRVVHRGEFYPSSASLSLAALPPQLPRAEGADSGLFTLAWAVTSPALRPHLKTTRSEGNTYPTNVLSPPPLQTSSRPTSS